MAKKYTLQDFIIKANIIHNNKYDYSKVVYTNSQTKVCIICPEHGEFWQKPNNHLNGKGCPSCFGNKKHTLETFVSKAKEIHGNKYDYSKVEYVNATTKVCIICPKHGEFWQTPDSHLHGSGCIKCSFEREQQSNLIAKETFISKAKEIHGNKYDYSKAKYVSSNTKVCIICPEHGEFWQKPSAHLRGQGCPQCNLKPKITNESFIERANKVHNNKYVYTKINVIGADEKVCIICPEHGEFWQKTSAHLRGHGCPHCHKSFLENEIEKLLNENNIKYIPQKRFTWLYRLSLDFYLPDFNIAIECQGSQHFEVNDFFGGISEFSKVQERDKRKKRLCEEHQIKLLYFSNNPNDSCIHSHEEILEQITSR